MKIYFFALLLIICVIAVTSTIKRSGEVDELTKRLCREYARKDHEKEFASTRWEYLKRLGDPNDIDFWYTSCINHHAYPVGGKENDWLKR
jgi:hypothetical protein